MARQNPKARLIRLNSKVYTEKVASSEAAVRLLDIAGFHRSATTSDALELTHGVPALLIAVYQVCDID